MGRAARGVLISGVCECHQRGHRDIVQCLSYVFDNGYVPGSQWSVLMMEFHHEFLFSSFDGKITVP